MTKTLKDLSLYSETTAQGVKVGDILVLNSIEYLIVSNDISAVFLVNIKTGMPWASSCAVGDNKAYLSKQVLKNILGSRQHSLRNIEFILGEGREE